MAPKNVTGKKEPAAKPAGTRARSQATRAKKALAKKALAKKALPVVPAVGPRSKPRRAARRLPSESPTLDDLAPYEVAVPAAWRAVTEPDREYPHRCFERSQLFVVALFVALAPDDPARTRVRLVHGRYMGGFPHGWVELPGDVVFDGVNQRFYGRADYYRVARAEPWYRYGPGVVALVGLAQPPDGDGATVVGDWHALLGLPDEPSVPTDVPLRDAVARAERAGWAVPPMFVEGPAGAPTRGAGRRRGRPAGE